MNHVVQTDHVPWKPFVAPTLQGCALKPEVIGAEYTDAYSVDLVRIAAGGCSSSHTDAARHAFFILEGEGELSLGPQVHALNRGTIAKIPPGVPHELRNTGAVPLVLSAIYDPPRRRSLD